MISLMYIFTIIGSLFFRNKKQVNMVKSKIFEANLILFLVLFEGDKSGNCLEDKNV